MSFVINGQEVSHSNQLPLNKGLFYCAASLTNAAAQYMPPSALATTLTANTGILVTMGGTNQSVISGFRVRFTGDAANGAGQTVTFQILQNGVAVASGVSTALATTAGVKTDSVSLATSPITLSDGDRIAITLTPSAGLTAVLTDISVALG